MSFGQTVHVKCPDCHDPLTHSHAIKCGSGRDGEPDAEADMLLAEALSAICVQKFDGSRNSAIHTTYRISLRSSSLREPRYPSLRVVMLTCHGVLHGS